MIVVVGVSHRTAPLPVRESLAFAPASLGEALRRLRAEAGSGEAIVTVRSAVDLPLGLQVAVRSRAVADLEASLALARAGGGR